MFDVAIPETTSLTLLRNSIGGNRFASEQLYEIYFPLVYLWCRKFRIQEADAQDIAQSVMIRVYGSLSQYQRGKGRFRGWLWTITRNAVHDHIRKNRRAEQSLGEAAADLLAEEPIEARSVELPSIVACQALKFLENRLRPRSLEIVRAVLCDGRSPSDVAAEFGVSAGSVHTARSRAVKLLREAFGDLEFSGRQ